MEIKNLNILHISDVHFRMNDNTNTQKRITKALVNAIKKYENVIDYCIFTGDLANIASDDEYDLAEDWLLNIYTAIDNVQAKMIICPGNHDIDRGNTSLSHFRGAASSHEAFTDFLTHNRSKFKHLDVFLNWHKKFQSKNDWVISSWNKDVNLVIEQYENININFIIANSAVLSCGNSDQGYLCVDTNELHSCLSNCEDNGGINIFSMHHPLGDKWFSEWNENEVKNTLSQKNGCHLLLSGHVHNAEGQNYSNNWGQSLATFECGSAYTGGKWKKEFSILEINLNESTVLPNNYVYSDRSGEWIKNNEQSQIVKINLENVKVLEGISKKKMI